MSDADFSTALELYFGNRLAEVEREHSWFNSKGESAAARKRRAQRGAAGESVDRDGLGPRPRARGNGGGDGGAPPDFSPPPPYIVVGDERMAVDGGEREEGEYRIGDDDGPDGLGATLVEGEASPTTFDDNDNGPWAARRTSR